MFVSTRRGFIVEQCDCTEKHIYCHSGSYSLKQYNNLKALQDENATTSPRDVHKAKERKREKGQDSEDLSSHRPCDETWLLCSLGPSGCRLDLSGGGGCLKEVVGKNPQNIKSILFLFTQFQVGSPRFLPWREELHTGSCHVVDHETLQEPLTPFKKTQLPITASTVALVLAQSGPSAEMNTVRPHGNVLVLPLGEEREPHSPVVCAREGSLEGQEAAAAATSCLIQSPSFTLRLTGSEAAITHPELTSPSLPKHPDLHRWGNVWSHYPLRLHCLTVCRWIEWTKPVTPSTPRMILSL